MLTEGAALNIVCTLTESIILIGSSSCIPPTIQQHIINIQYSTTTFLVTLQVSHFTKYGLLGLGNDNGVGGCKVGTPGQPEKVRQKLQINQMTVGQRIE